MKKLLGRVGIRTIVSIALLGTVTAGLFTVLAGKPTDEKFDQELYKYYWNARFRDLEQCLDRFPILQAQWIRLVPPGMPVLLVDEKVKAFEVKGFPKKLIAGLIPVVRDEVTFYPITIVEDPDTRDYVFFNSDAKEIYRVPPPEGYDSEWLVKLKIPWLYDGSLSKEEIEEFRWTYDSSRVAVSYDLITEKDLIDYVIQLSKPPEDPEVVPMKAYTGPPVTNIQFTWIEPTSNGMELTIAYPSGYTNDLDIFRTETLMNNPFWDRVCTTNVSATNWIEWTDTSVAGWTNGRMFYAAANADCTAATDADSDGLPWGREHYQYHTCPTNYDTDGDNIGDGDEVAAGTDPNNSDTNKPTVTIILPGNNTERIWIP